MDGAPNMIKNDRSLIAPFTKKKKNWTPFKCFSCSSESVTC